MVDLNIEKLKSLVGNIEGITVSEITLPKPFIDFVAGFSNISGTVILMSGGESDCAKYHILATLPWLSLTSRKFKTTLRIDEQEYSFESDPFEVLRTVSNSLQAAPEQLAKNAPVPVQTGLFGYLSYDLKDFLESLPRTTMDDLQLPHMCFYAPSIMIISETGTNRSYRVSITHRLPDGRILRPDENLFNKISEMDHPERISLNDPSRVFSANFNRQGYSRAIETIQDYIRSGHVYQVNMSQRFEMKFRDDPFLLFKTLFKKNPAPFFAFIQAGDHQIVSTSPERFIKRDGNDLETRPIKGTRPRGISKEEDDKLRTALLNSKKDNAELSMIVDLLRNDMGKVCTAGSIFVKEHKRIEAYANVYHLVSIVKGKLHDKYDSVDLIKATFPGGSITGCPKIRSMEIIDELETCQRHVYTGSIGYISFHDTMDLSIAIRTATVVNNRIYFSAGGGIVYDSVPDEEYDETLHKGKTLMQTLEKTSHESEDTMTAWFNGALVPLNDISIPVTDLGFQYGYGFFETIRVDKGRPHFLKEHMQRFDHTWKVLFRQETLDLSWDIIIRQVVEKNNLSNSVCALKIIAAKGQNDGVPFTNNLIITCRPYTHRLSHKTSPGLNLMTFSEPRQTPIADHKTLNYLYYYLAGRQATENQADEALILNPDKTVSETNTANILLINNRKVIRPLSSHVLPGTMENAVCGLLKEWGYELIQNKMYIEDLLEADNAFMTNSLIGAVPVLSIDNRKLKHPTELWEKINDKVLQTKHWRA